MMINEILKRDRFSGEIIPEREIDSILEFVKQFADTFLSTRTTFCDFPRGV